MSILLTILKIIFIILLVLLGILLLAVALILFVPIHYKVDGERKEESQIEVWGSVRYLLSIFKLTFAYRDGELETDIYLFGFRKKKQLEEEAADGGAQADEGGLADETQAAEIPAGEAEEPEQAKSVEEQETVLESVPEVEKLPKRKQVKKKEKQKKIDFALIKQELNDEHNHNVVKKIFAELKYLLQHFKFRKIKTDLVFSTGDPASTGQLLGVLSMFPILYRYEFGIVPDFMSDDAYVKGTFGVTGRVRLIHILMTVLRLIFDKEVRLVIIKFMEMKNE